MNSDESDIPFGPKLGPPISGTLYTAIDLARLMRAEWLNHISGDYKPPTLPSQSTLERLTEQCFLASLLTDEARPCKFSIVFSETARTPFPRGTSENIPSFTFDFPRPVTASELRRLSAICNPESGALWCTYDPKDSSQLAIAGILGTGGSWLAARQGITLAHTPPPHALIIRVLAPGELTVFQGEHLFATLRDGRLKPASVERMLDHMHLSDFCNAGLEAFEPQLKRPTIEPSREWYDYEYLAYQSVIIGLINYIQTTRHGGNLTLMMDGPDSTDQQTELLKFKYALAKDDAQPLRRAFLDYLNARHAWADMLEQWERTSEPPPVSTAMELALHKTAAASRALSSAVGLVGRFGATDGLLAVNNRLDVVGFGGEIRAPAKFYEPVLEAVDQLARETKSLDIERFGMRHRSAIRYIASNPTAISYVISQDGSVTLVRSDKGRVVVRTDIDATSPLTVL